MVCEKCPFKTSLDVAEELLNQVVNPEANRALGGIAITRKSLELTAEKVECDGENISQDGSKVCPLKDTVMSARTFATAVWAPSAFVADLNQGITSAAPESQQHGTYI